MSTVNLSRFTVTSTQFFEWIRRNTKQVGQTQYGRVLKELAIELICANSSQAKGRVERANLTLQKTGWLKRCAGKVSTPSNKPTPGFPTSPPILTIALLSPLNTQKTCIVRFESPSKNSTIFSVGKKPASSQNRWHFNTIKVIYLIETYWRKQPTSARTCQDTDYQTVKSPSNTGIENSNSKPSTNSSTFNKPRSSTTNASAKF